MNLFNDLPLNINYDVKAFKPTLKDYFMLHCSCNYFRWKFICIANIYEGNICDTVIFLLV